MALPWPSLAHPFFFVRHSVHAPLPSTLLGFAVCFRLLHWDVGSSAVGLFHASCLFRCIPVSGKVPECLLSDSWAAGCVGQGCTPRSWPRLARGLYQCLPSQAQPTLTAFVPTCLWVFALAVPSAWELLAFQSHQFLRALQISLATFSHRKPSLPLPQSSLPRIFHS